MKAVRIHAAGDLRIDDIPTPEPGPGEVLVALEWGGVCGSDLGYWRSGASGTSVLREPLVLGHEVAGTISALGEGVEDLQVGRRVTVHPATVVPGQELPEAIAGRTNLYPQVRYFGSAAFVPHEDGGFCAARVVRADQIRLLPETVSTRHGAVAEPLGVALHAVHRSGGVDGLRVLVNGAGPIGSLVAAAARHSGAAEVTVADLAPSALEIARRMGAHATVDVSAGQELPADVDVTIEASGAPAALAGVFAATRRGGVVVQVGNLPGGKVEAALGAVVTREIDYRGSYRFVDEISDALTLMAQGLDVEPLLTHTFPIDEAQQAFEVAADRSTGSSKVMLELS